ncbi:MAG: FecR domain-containing protein [Comamonas sp.]
MRATRSPIYASLCLAWYAWTPLPALAASADQLPDLQHVVQPGDTLQRIAQRYLQDPQQWPELGRVNSVRNPRQLPVGSVILIPKALIGYQNATVEHLQGTAQTRSGAQQPWQPLAVGMTLTEGDDIEVADNSNATLKLSDGSHVQIAANSQLHLQQLRQNQRSQAQQSVIELKKGGVDSAVNPSEGRTKRRFDIKTPLATTSVRGTRFSVQLTDSGSAVTAVDQGVVAVNAAHAARPAAVAAGSGLAVGADGKAGSVVRQLDAPGLQDNPAVFEDADFLTVRLGAVGGARQYQVAVARDEALQQLVYRKNFAQPTATMPAVPDGSYYVAARALDAQDIPGRPAVRAIKVKAHPVPPLYQSPAPQGLIGTDDGELVCTEGGAGIVAYRIQVAADAQFTQPLKDFQQLERCSSGLQGLPAGNYFWRAATIRRLGDGSLDQGPFAKPQAFRAGRNPPSLGADSLGVGDAAMSQQLQLSWPAEAGQQFNLQLSPSAQFDGAVTEARLEQPRWTSEQLAPGDYYVRIQVLDPSGLKSKYSEPRKLSVKSLIATGGDGNLVIRTRDGKPVQSPR